jgi:DNA helicase-2/ATP-dependent DNA helicase PcrA
MVAASMGQPRAQYAKSTPPSFPLSKAHLEFQKYFVKANGGDIGSPSSSHKAAVELIDKIRNELAKTPKPRLTLAGFISRLLSLPLFRNCGFTTALFRQALFTSLLEANIAPTRLTRESLDSPLEVSKKGSRYVWPDRFWTLLSVFGGYLDGGSLDDPEIESFEQDAVLLLTFHQAKGLEFDHVYVAGTGRKPDIAPALRTRLFSGETPEYRLTPDGISTRDKSVLDLALADREREVYVAMTRAKAELTILHDPSQSFGPMLLNQILDSMFAAPSGQAHPSSPSVSIRTCLA